MERATIGEIEHALGDPDFPVRALMDKLADHGLRVERVNDDLSEHEVIHDAPERPLGRIVNVSGTASATGG